MTLATTQPRTAQPTAPSPRLRRPRHARAGLSLVEMLVSLAITALLLTATMVAIDASFHAYASAAQSASTQATTRLVVHRLLTLVRTSTAHGPLQVMPGQDPPVLYHVRPDNSIDQNTLVSHYIELIDSQGNLVRVEYRAQEQQLWVITTPYGSNDPQAQPLIGGVTECTFYIHRRFDRDGVLVLERGTVDFIVQPDEDNTLAYETGKVQPMRVIASTMPRRLD